MTHETCNDHLFRKCHVYICRIHCSITSSVAEICERNPVYSDRGFRIETEIDFTNMSNLNVE